MIRLATPQDAPQLYQLNEQFNGPGGAPVEAIAAALAANAQEVVAVAQVDGALAGFACAQVKRSFCYQSPPVEVTEVFVSPACRRRGLARAMLAFLEDYCAEKFGASEFTLLTGRRNAPAQALYRNAGYTANDELMMEKGIHL